MRMKMRKSVGVLMALAGGWILLAGWTASAQNLSQAAYRHAFESKTRKAALSATALSQSSPRHSFDVLSYTLNLNVYKCFVTPYPHSYSATDVIRFMADSTLSTLQLHAVNSSLVVDSVAGRSFSHSGDILTINLGGVYNPGDTGSVVISYHHNDVADGAFYVSSGMVFTDCEPEGARKWFPCWDRPADKATLDLTAKVPNGVKLGSNGRLVSAVLSGDTILYHWASRDPIATYLMVMTGKVGYNLDQEYWKTLANPNDSIPVVFYWNAGEDTASLHDIERNVPQMATYYSTLFGEYPFEKIGMATIAPGAGFIWGGMENQTLISVEPNSWDEYLIAHEFAHHWFGDMISPGTWADVWLNEAFATYCEALWDEHRLGEAAYHFDIVNDAAVYLSQNPGWPIYNPQWAVATPNVNTMFNDAITYEKGACVLHMLRYTLGDSTFFSCLKAYTTDTAEFRLKNVVTADFFQKISSAAGQDLSWFFNEWILQPNHPVYHNLIVIDSAGRQVDVTFRQSQANASFFTMPVELKVSFASSPDSTIRVLNNANGQKVSFTFADYPRKVVFDPNDNIPLKVDSTTVSGVPPLKLASPYTFSLGQNYPNPFNPSTTVKFSVAEARHVSLRIYDILGRPVATLVDRAMIPGEYTAVWDGAAASSGVYFYRLEAGEFTQTKKLMLVK